MEQAKKLLSALTPVQRWSIVLCALGVAGLVVWFARFEQQAGMRPLFSSLSAEDANAMVQKLREAGVSYRVSDDGTRLLVPEERVAELRLEMAGLGLPKTGRIGFEIFDKTNFGITDFAEHVNYRRAVEGELERSVMALAAVQQARVHVTLPKDSVFTESRESAKASVLVGLKAGARLSAQNVNAITNLVSSAVEGLAPEAISVVDMNGNLLSRPHRDGPPDSTQISEAALEYRQAIEHDLVAKINSTLEPLLGADKFRTGVSADVDMTIGEQSEETYDPTKSVMLTSQKTEDSSGSTRATAVQPPGTASNLPPAPAPGIPAATTATAESTSAAGSKPGSATASSSAAAFHPPASGSSSSKRSESITYQTSRVVKHMKLPQGTIKRLSIAVLLDQGAKWEGQGKQMHRVVTPPDADKLKSIQALVSTLVGLNTERGDQITVEALPFDGTLNMEPPEASNPESTKTQHPQSLIETLNQKPTLLWGSVGGGAFALAMILFVVARGKKKTGTPAMPEVIAAGGPQASLPPASPSQAAVQAGDMPQFPALMPSRSEVLLKQLQDAGRNNPEAWAGVLRGWLSEEEAS